jgi:LysM repeat protein
MSRPNPPRTSYGRDRVCPHCGTRVAQKAQTCFFCGGALEGAPARRFRVPWADLFLFAAIAGVLVLWWVRGLDVPDNLQTEQVARQVATAALPDSPASLEALAPEEPPTVTLVPSPIPPTLTPEPTGTATPLGMTATPVPPTRYRVQSGDTVIGIAQKFGSSVKDIIQANDLSADGRLGVGQELVIPVAGPMGGAAPVLTPTPTATGGALMYVVRTGDTISSIAQRYHSTIDWIFKANNIKAGDVLRIGQALLIPLSAETPTPAATSAPLMETPTSTAEPALAAPVLLGPANGSVLAGQAEVLLNWTSVGILEPDQYYVVTLTAGDERGPTTTWWTKATTWRMPPEYRGKNGASIDYRWRVQVRHGSAEAPGLIASPSSDEFRFTWR